MIRMQMSSIFPKSPRPALNSSTHLKNINKPEQRVTKSGSKLNSYFRKETYIFRQNRYPVISAGGLGFSTKMSLQMPEIALVQKRNCSPGIPGSGAGRGGGAGGSIKESGGGLGRYGAANEEGYFYAKNREEVERLKKELKKGEKKDSQDPQKKEE